ncbi:MAG TPA: glycosyltransferase family 2 protein [Bdellovibrionota bacterium]|jgi:glycosyltransferase involved in cell wall biosynthesis
MTSRPKASLVLATYQWPEALALVLSGLVIQSEKQFELLIADDGSDARTKETIRLYQQRVSFPIRHFWQENKGFRKSRILNEAIRAAQGDTLIFLDGDCVPHCEYVAQHLALQSKGHYVAGRRVDLSKKFTETLNPTRVEMGALSGGFDSGIFDLWLDSLRRDGSKPFHRAYMVHNSAIRRLCGLDKVDDMKGCNFSVSREAMLAIDGFDQSYEGYGREDTDVELRLQNLGLKIRSAKNLCLQFHLWHEPRAFTPANESLLDEVKNTKRVKALRGLGAAS